MKLDITRNIVPPNGVLCPTNQTIVISNASFSLTDLTSKMQQPCPTGFSISVIGGSGQATAIFIWNGTGFEDDINGGLAPSQTITGIVQMNNPAGYDIEIIW